MNTPPASVNGHPHPGINGHPITLRPRPVDAVADLVPEPANPMAVARHLAPQWTRDGLLTLRHWRGTWMAWAGSYWRELDDQQIKTSLYTLLEHATYLHQPPKGPEEERPWAPAGRKVSDLMQAIAATTHLEPDTDPPAWLHPPTDPLTAGSSHTAQHPPAGGGPGGHGPIVACTNGLLRVADRALTDLTPRFFNLVSVPFDYHPHAAAPTWHTFLRRAWPDDPASIAALQEWFGYVLSGRTDQQKILLIVGPTRSGKGTIARVLGALVGAGNMAGPTLASLGSNFGLSALLGKSLAVIADARLAGRDGHQVVERLLTISGEDTIDVDRKFRQPWTGKLPTRLMILSNELPNFGDSSGVIARRFIVLNMTVSWLGKEDPALLDKLTAEMPGILNWALDGLDRLVRNGRLTEPAASLEAVTTMQDTASPVSAFVRECCTTGPDQQVPVDALWGAWKDWAEDSGHRPGTKQLLGRNLLSIVPQMQRSKPRGPDGKQVPTYLGVALSRDEPDVSRTEPDNPRSPAALSPALIRAEPDEPRYFAKSPPQGQLALCTACGQPLAPLRTGQTTHPSCQSPPAHT
ncbi:DNA primase family protein [Streptomyces sp. CA2R106]|uniref:DNA primase family protein n=1 Tax=Streptomyces sp. CA2R106 TaxID=3120153 RepID=UPI00300B7F4E